MPRDQVRGLLVSRLAATVDAGVGCWAEGIADHMLGQGTFAYRDEDVELTLYEGGLRYGRGDEAIALAYTEITEVETLTLRELSTLQYAANDPRPPIDRATDLRLRVGATMHRLRMPLKVYTSLHSPLLSIVEHNNNA